MRTEIIGSMDVAVEDSGKAKIGTIYGEEGNLFIRIQSWDEELKHEEFVQLEGKKVRVTIEVLEEPGNDKIYYYLFTVNGGKLPFGYHGTEAQWAAKKLLDYSKDTVFLIKKEYCCTVQEQEEYSKLSWAEKVALSEKEHGNSQQPPINN